MNWANRYDWSTHTQGYFNSADGTGWANSNGFAAHGGTRWANTTGVPYNVPASDFDSFNCSELTRLYNMAWQAYYTATSSPTGTAQNVDGSGDYSTADQFRAFISTLQNVMANRPDCKVPQPPPPTPPTPPTGSSIGHGTPVAVTASGSTSGAGTVSHGAGGSGTHAGASMFPKPATPKIGVGTKHAAPKSIFDKIFGR
jgi:hypothetical protein